MWESAKIASIFILIALSIISGVFSFVTVKCLVAKFGKSTKFQWIISVLNCFSGGVFFATCILDILPEGREKMEEAKVDWGWDTEYPLSELLMGIGFLMILTLEHGAHTCFHFRSSLAENAKNPEKVHESPETVEKGGANLESSFTHETSNRKTRRYGSMDTPSDKTNFRFTAEPTIKNDVKILGYSSDKIPITQNTTSGIDEEVTTSVALKTLADTSDNKSGQTSIRGIVLLSALSLHMIFDGLALGLLDSSGKIWSLLLALGLHKSLVFYTIGLQTLELLGSIRKSILAICFFSLISPLGIVIGESIGSSGSASTQASAAAILQGIAAGTFIYVTFFEILQREFSQSGHDLLKVFVTVLGFSLIGVMRLLESDGDESGTDP